MNWDDPVARAALIERVGPGAYNAAFLEYLQASAVATVNGHRIRPVQTRFGRLFQVGDTGRAYRTLIEAARFAEAS